MAEDGDEIFRREIKLRVHDYHFITEENVWLAWFDAMDDLADTISRERRVEEARAAYEREFKSSAYAIVLDMGIEIIPTPK